MRSLDDGMFRDGAGNTGVTECSGVRAAHVADAPPVVRGAIRTNTCRSNREPHSSFLIVTSLWTALTCAVARAIATTLSAAAWLLALPLSHTTPSSSVST